VTLIFAVFVLSCALAIARVATVVLLALAVYCVGFTWFCVSIERGGDRLVAYLRQRKP
jgi:hypothetical protein